MRTCRTIMMLLLVGAALVGACAPYQRSPAEANLVVRGEFGAARELAERQATHDPSDRSFMLDRMKIMLLSLADGVPEATDANADYLYDYLRTQGVNEGKEPASFFFTEGAVRVWKGDPFEQAMAFHYIAVLDGLRGDWGNVRASASSSLFLLRDFSRALRAAPPNPRQTAPTSDREAVIRAAADRDQGGASNDQPGTLNVPVDLAPSDFELGYVLKAIASRQLHDAASLDEALRSLDQIAPQLRSYAEQIRSGNYNTVFVVDFGLGPTKYAAGPDGAIAEWGPTAPYNSDGPLDVRVNGEGSSWPVVTDLNRIARDLKWSNLEDMRVAKSTLSNVAMITGATMAATSRDRTTQWVGLGLLALGALGKGSSAADTRYCDVMPQRVYVALLNLREPTNTVVLTVRGMPGGELVVPDVPAPPAGKVGLRYARVADGAPAWAVSGRVLYGNDETGASSQGRNLPFILGGNDVRTPTEGALKSYQQSGYLRGFSLSDLKELYRMEGIIVAADARALVVGKHVLEGGDWLYSPEAGSAGFARLLGQSHPPYNPKTSRVKDLTQQQAGQSGQNRAN